MSVGVKSALAAGCFVVAAALIGAYTTIEIKKSETKTRKFEALSAERIETGRLKAEDAERKRKLERALRLVDIELQLVQGHAQFLSVLDSIPPGLSARSGTLLPSKAWNANRGILADELAPTDREKWDDLVTFYLRLETYRVALSTLAPKQPLNGTKLVWAFRLCWDVTLVRPSELGEPPIGGQCFWRTKPLGGARPSPLSHLTPTEMLDRPTPPVTELFKP